MLVGVVGGDERDAPGGLLQSADDGGEHLGKVRRDDQQAFGVGLGRSDLQQRHQATGAGQSVLHQAVVAERAVPPYARGGAEHLDDRPGPKGMAFFPGEVATFPGTGVVDPHGQRWLAGYRPGQGLPPAVNVSPGGVCRLFELDRARHAVSA